jgi:type IV secretory pathway component VirB8
MKKLIALFVFLMYVLPMYSQSKNFELYRCSFININSLLSTGEWKDTTYNVSYLISIELDNSIVSFDNGSNTTLYISVINNISNIKKDAEDKEYVETIYFCHDQDNISCQLTIINYTGLPDRVFKVQYTNIVAIIYAKLIKPANPIQKPVKNNSDDGNSGIHRG